MVPALTHRFSVDYPHPMGAWGVAVGAVRGPTGSGAGTAQRRGPRSLERSAFLSQFAVVSAMLCLAGVITVANLRILASPMVLAGYALLGALTAATVLVEWSRMPKSALLIIPLGDILAIALTTFSSGTVAFSLLYTLPVIWLATHFRLLGVVLSVILPTVFPIARVGISRIDSGTMITQVVVIPVGLGLVAVTVYLSRRRVDAQRTLLRRQAEASRQAEAQGRRHEDYLDATLEAVGFGIVTFDLEGRPGLINTVYRKMRLHVDGRADGPEFCEVYAADGFTLLPEAERPARRAADGDLRETVVWVGPPGGVRLALAVSARRTYDLAGRADGVVMISRDVTSERLAVRARDDLVAMVSHELRTPLTAIIGYLDLALDSDIEDT
ncbi:MAG TPA: histidine kinase dimerization/phospho-acceptor domain-containing protein, partial [Microbacteriaceae bacterium]